MKSARLASLVFLIAACAPAKKEVAAVPSPSWELLREARLVSVAKIRFPDSERYVFFGTTSVNQRTSSLLKLPWTFRSLAAASQFARSRPGTVTLSIGDKPMLIDDANILIEMSGAERDSLLLW